MTRHTLKTWPEYFQKVVDNKKKAELRLNDRNFQIGDKMLLQEYNPEIKDYTGRELLVRITDMTEGTGHLISGHVMLSFEIVR